MQRSRPLCHVITAVFDTIRAAVKRSLVWNNSGVQPADPGGVSAGQPYLQGQRAAEERSRRANQAREVLPPLHGAVFQGGAAGADVPRDSAVQDEQHGVCVKGEGGGGGFFFGGGFVCVRVSERRRAGRRKRGTQEGTAVFVFPSVFPCAFFFFFAVIFFFFATACQKIRNLSLCVTSEFSREPKWQ